MLIDLADLIVERNYKEVLKLFLRVDEIMADSDFTNMVFDAFMAQKREMDRADEAT